MTVLNVAYRLTVFAPKTVDATEVTVLTPTTGAPHSDAFKVATSEGIAGFKPYLGMPSGRRGRVDLMAKKTDTGELSFDILDARITAGGLNAQRWVTAFAGDAKNLPQFTRLKVFVEETLDGGVTWTPFFTGRIRTIALRSGSRAGMTMSIRDISDDLSFNIFTGMPHEIVRQTAARAVTSATSTTLTDSTASYAVNFYAGAYLSIVKGKGIGQIAVVLSNTATVFTVAAWSQGITPDSTSQYALGYSQLVSVMPVGFVRPYGIAQVTHELTGTITSLDSLNNWALVTLGSSQQSLPANQYTATLQAATNPWATPWNTPSSSQTDATKIVPTFSGLAVAHVTRTDTGQEGDFYAGYGYVTQTTQNAFGGGTNTLQLWGLTLRPMSYPTGVATGTPLVSTGTPFTPMSTLVTTGDGGTSSGSNTTSTLNDTTKSWTVNAWTGLAISIIAGTGAGQLRFVASNTATQVTLVTTWGVTPDATSVYVIGISTNGWTASTTSILAAGDIISFAGDPQRYFVITSTNSDSSGNATVALSPGIQTTLTNGQVITVQKSPNQMALPPATTPVKLHVICDIPIADGGQTQDVYNSQGARIGTTPKPGNLLLINDVHPAQLLKDVLLGYYGRIFRPQFDQNSIPSIWLPVGKNLGDPFLAFGVQLTDPVGDGRHGFNALIADATFPTFRCVIDKSMPIREFIEKYICQPYGIGYYFDGSGNFVPVDMRQPTSIPGGIITLTDADLVEDKPANWSYDSSQAVTQGQYTIYGEAVFTQLSAQIIPGHPFPEITTKMFDVQGGPVLDFALGNPALGQKQYSVDYKGFRAMPGETGAWIDYNGIPRLESRYQVMAQMAIAMANLTVARPYGNGVQIIVLTCQRNANTASLFPGSLVIVNVAANVDVASNTRGPSRLVMLTERAETDATVKFTGIDWGVTITSNPPTLGAPIQLPNDGSHSCQCYVTANAQNEPVEAWVNVTNTSVGSRPVDSDPGWTFVGIAAWSWNFTKRSLPAGVRVWWRARTSPKRIGYALGFRVLVNALKLPSAWAYAPSSVDLGTLNAPTGLASSNVTASGFTVTWANPDPTKTVEVWLSFPTTDPATFLARLPAGSTQYLFRGLSASSTYRARIRTVDAVGGFAEATLDVATISTQPIIKPPLSTGGGGTGSNLKTRYL